MQKPADIALSEAADAVRQEYREATRPEALRYTAAEIVAQGPTKLIARFTIAGAIDFDWTWEGSVASRLDGADPWHGEVVEIDPVRRQLYVAVHETIGDHEGKLLVEPFPFIRPLAHIYGAAAHESLRPILGERLLFMQSGEHPLASRVASKAIAGLEEAWRHRVAILWGPPGTGKTFTVGEQVAEVLATSDERMLVVSTTNKATDAAALSIGTALERHFGRHDFRIRRVGAGADYRAFERAGLVDVLVDGAESERDARRALAGLLARLRSAQSPMERAPLRVAVKQARRGVLDTTFDVALDERVRVVVATAYSALALLATAEIAELVADAPPFHSVVIDEAGLVSRAAAAALSLLGSERSWLVGDPRQLAPITRITRVLPPNRAAWLAESALAHLDPANPAAAASVALLRTQHRMHPAIREVVSRYQYGGHLDDAPRLAHRRRFDTPLLREAPRAIWYVLDDDGAALPDIRAERGPGGRSYRRRHSIGLVERLLTTELGSGPGLFLSPFVAQAQAIDSLLAEKGLTQWSASTVHAQQGAEADFVIFDTVNAGSYLWPPHEWERIVNVALSRAREIVIVLSSRKEMQEIYLRRLKPLLAPRVLRWRGRRHHFTEVPVERSFDPPPPNSDARSHAALGAQLDARKRMRPVLTREQERLCAYTMDGKPRLVRGVAGSGKTVILASWLAQTAAQHASNPQARIWVIYGNRALGSMLWDSVEAAWHERGHTHPFPRERVEIRHVHDVLTDLHARECLRPEGDLFDYEAQATRFAARTPDLDPLCDALFIDEAQDLGHETLRLFFRLVRDHNAIVFFDNAQNVYSRSRPTWSELGLDIRGRATVLEESYRATRPICELALNVFYRLRPPTGDDDHAELLRRGLIEHTTRSGAPYYRVHFNDIDGPSPHIAAFSSRTKEIAWVAARVAALIRDDAVQPRDIRILHVGKNIGDMLVRALHDALAPLHARAALETSQTFSDDAATVVITTPQSFKGYDAEIAMVVAADRFRAGDTILAPALYVAMTRARSILEISYTDSRGPDDPIISALESTRRALRLPDE